MDQFGLTHHRFTRKESVQKVRGVFRKDEVTLASATAERDLVVSSQR